MSNYSIIAEQKREEIIFLEEYGSYQGEFVMATEKDGVLRIYKDYYGSCSGCDNYESEFGCGGGPVLDSEKVIKFVEQYEPFLERNISELTYTDIYDGITIGNKDSRDFKIKEQHNLIEKLCEKYSIKK